METLAEIDATAAWYDGQRAGLDLEFLSALRSTLAALKAAPGISNPDRVAPRDAPPALPRATISAWSPPALECQPSLNKSPSRATTAPTRGFGATE